MQDSYPEKVTEKLAERAKQQQQAAGGVKAKQAADRPSAFSSWDDRRDPMCVACLISLSLCLSLN